MSVNSCHHRSKDSIVVFMAMISRSCIVFQSHPTFPLLQFYCGVTVPAEVVNYATAFDTIRHDPMLMDP